MLKEWSVGNDRSKPNDPLCDARHGEPPAVAGPGREASGSHSGGPAAGVLWRCSILLDELGCLQLGRFTRGFQRRAGSSPGSAEGHWSGRLLVPDPNAGRHDREEFAKTSSDLKLQFVLGEYDSNTKTMATLAAGNPPDLSYLGRWQGPDLAVRNGIFAMDDKIKLASAWKWSNVWPRLQKDSIQWGKTWVVPYSTDTRAFFYNKRNQGLSRCEC